ncbi:MAG: sulfite exporter TauE/SafE family protein [Chloroflexia bacterium]
MDILYYLGLAATGFVAGLLGALLGLGGGVFVVPALRLIFGLPFLTAIGTSNVAVIATSTAGASTYVRNRLANIRLALVLLVSTTAAALLSSLVAAYVPVQILSGLFAVVLLYTSYSMRRGTKSGSSTSTTEPEPETPDPLNLSSEYHDGATGKTETYRPKRVGTGVSISALAGVIAGLLGVGGGLVQMPVMNLLMGVPIKVATGTSNLMIGITSTSAAFVRYANGDIDPLIAVPIALFVFFGARVGAWLVPRTPNARLKQIFSWVAIIIAGLMILQALGIYSATKR